LPRRSVPVTRRMSLPTKVAIPMYAPNGVMVEYSPGVSATRNGVPSSDAGAFSDAASGDGFPLIPLAQYARRWLSRRSRAGSTAQGGLRWYPATVRSVATSAGARLMQAHG
jgi:hypothetical protein